MAVASSSDKCYKYSPNSDSWVESGTMSGPKFFSALDFAESWGLVMAQYGLPLEVTKNGEDFEELAAYPNPDVVTGHAGCLVMIDDNQLLLAGGSRELFSESLQ